MTSGHGVPETTGERNKVSLGWGVVAKALRERDL